MFGPEELGKKLIAGRCKSSLVFASTEARPNFIWTPFGPSVSVVFSARTGLASAPRSS
jgi:hypothetical protein